MKIYYPSYEQNRKHILQHTDFIESVVMNTPTRAYTHQKHFHQLLKHK